jgi:hypothetical protein
MEIFSDASTSQATVRIAETIVVRAKSCSFDHVPAARPGERRRESMNALLAFIAVAICIAAPAFAQPTRAGQTQVRAPRQEQLPAVHPYSAERSYPRPRYDYNNNVNPDFQLGGSDR